MQPLHSTDYASERRIQGSVRRFNYVGNVIREILWPTIFMLVYVPFYNMLIPPLLLAESMFRVRRQVHDDAGDFINFGGSEDEYEEEPRRESVSSQFFHLHARCKFIQPG